VGLERGVGVFSRIKHTNTPKHGTRYQREKLSEGPKRRVLYTPPYYEQKILALK
jgi:hypothetical protein